MAQSTPAQNKEFLTGRLLVVAFEGWNDAGEAATGAVRLLKEQLDMAEIIDIDSEDFFDYQFNRPTSEFDDDGQRILVWPNATMHGPAAATAVPEQLATDAGLAVTSSNTSNVYLLIGTEPSRNWKRFTNEVLNVAVDAGVSGIVFLGAMLADVPHTRPISIYSTSENAEVRSELDIERSTYEGPVGILSVLADSAEQLGIPTISLWASVPHYVHNAPSPKATLALVDRLEELIDVVIPRGDLVEEATAWETGIDALAGEDEEMASYIQQLEQARDTVDSPEASGEAIAQEFERYLRKRGDGAPPAPGSAGPAEPWRP
ncbi:PAC2 family protein [Subtercola boreus]|uniref:Carboxylate--amine ligase n=1 Tax=Subtercola boreus TaxID=120213 RepID=A0A3E0WAZ6_9MICO|nr:PAC2 family protein [Subtercola boreus]RFA21215.1 carboxylate--amine ligase [Subtercola boreus]RFA21598.1 carboxylate--amine ligase [Subtercola boreus]RFA27567.1 carboxylate--amine ligase [Subtercola boreus]